MREVKLAIVADVGSLARLPLILSDGHLRELALTGKNIDAARAEKIGLVNDVYDDADASLAAAHATAAEIAGNPPLTVHGIKDVLDQQRIAQGLGKPSLRGGMERSDAAVERSHRRHHRDVSEAGPELHRGIGVQSSSALALAFDSGSRVVPNAVAG